MNKLYVLILALPLVLCACKKDDSTPTDTGSPAPKMSTAPSGEANNSKVVGTWKADPSKSSTATMSEDDKAQMAKFEVEFKADGTFETRGDKTPSSGTWTLSGDKVMLKSSKGDAPPELTLGADGNLTLGSPDGKESVVFTKA